MRNIRQDLIQQQLQEGCTKDVNFKRFAPTRRFVDWLFEKYQIVEYSVHYYDREPDVPPEWRRGGAEWNDPEFKRVWRGLVKAYEPKRILFCNWIDLFGVGLWDWTQGKADCEAIAFLEELIETVTDAEDRFYVGFERGGRAFLYFYGRDTMQYDVWFCLNPRRFAS